MFRDDGAVRESAVSGRTHVTQFRRRAFIFDTVNYTMIYSKLHGTQAVNTGNYTMDLMQIIHSTRDVNTAN